MHPNEIWEDANANDEELNKKSTENKDFFKVRNANEWVKEAKKKPVPKMLFGELWYEGEVCIMFADTNLGKSILAVQIADSISRGVTIPGFRLEADAQKVLYFDFELTMKQFENRYSCNYQDHYQWSELMDRAEINPDADIPETFGSFENYVNDSLEQSVTKYGAKVIIVDNLTYLRSDTERARDANPLMKQLKGLKDQYGISILALAHTPKRDKSRPITDDDLGGSKHLMNFCDSSFAIGASTKGKELRYIKQVKERATSRVYGADNVCVCTIEKPHNFLQFVFKEHGAEWMHLKQESNVVDNEMKDKILELHKNGMPQKKIARELGISSATVNKYIRGSAGS